LLTGDPGVGKTTVVSKVVWKVQASGYSVGGILTRERRNHGRRTGFEIIDLLSGKTGELSSSELRTGPKVGKYAVNIQEFEKIGVNALKMAIDKADVVVCDEIGPMELLSPAFRRTATELLHETEKPKILVLHKRLKDPLLDAFRAAKECRMTEVTYENRDSLASEIVDEVNRFFHSVEKK
jgi:nucleoside-triphosphatase